MNGACNVKLFCSAPWGPGEGSKGQISFIFNYKVNFKDFYTKLCVCSHKWKIQNISDGIFILSPGSCPRGGTLWLCGCPGGQKNQTWSCGISNRRGWSAEQNASKIFILGSNWWPWGEVKGQISLKFGYHVNFKILIPNFVCVLTNERYKTYQTGFLFCCPGHAPKVGLWGTGGTQGGQTFFFQTWSCSISNRRGWRAERNASNIFILGTNLWLWGKVKRSNIINMSISKIFIPNFVCVLTNKRKKHIEQNFHSVAKIMPRGGTGGSWGSQKL